MIFNNLFSDGLRNRRKRWPAIVCITGFIVAVAGLQTWLFERELQRRADLSREQLDLLHQEHISNKTIDRALSKLQDYWRLSDDDDSRRNVLALRDSVVANYRVDPVGTSASFSNGVAELPARTEAQQHVLSQLQRDLEALKTMYAEHTAAAVDFYYSPGWYLQPTALFLTNSSKTSVTLQFNHAIYLSYVKQAAEAEELLNELRSAVEDPTMSSQILFALSRLQFEAYRVDKDPAFLTNALRQARYAVQSDASYSLAKLYLAYLLTIEAQTARVDSPTDQGEGSGEGEGERGAINADTGEF